MDVNAAAGVDMETLDRILASRTQVKASDLIPLLQEIQTGYGYLPRTVLLEMSRRTGIPASRMYGVVTFYSQFYLKPHGRHTIRACRGTACHVLGGKGVADSISRHLAISEGQTTADNQFTFETVACLGTCFLAPMMMVDSDYYGLLTPQKINNMLEQYARK